MNIQVFVQGQSGSHQHSWPEYPMRLEDVFPDEVLSFRPEFLKGVFTFVFQGTHIIDQRVKPYIRHIALVERDLDPPGQPALRARDTQITDWLSQHCQHFILEALGTNKVGMCLDVTEQSL